MLLLSSEFPPGPGGIGTHALQLANHMTNLGWQVQVLSSQDYAFPEEIQKFNCKQIFAFQHLDRSGWLLKNQMERLVHLAKVVRNWCPDILVATGDTMVWLTALAFVGRVLPAHLPWVSIWHGTIPINPFLKRFSAWAFGQSYLTVSVSQYSLGQLEAMGAKPPRKKIITNGADEFIFVPDTLLGQKFREKYNLPMDCKLLLTVGHVSERKGQDIVIRALSTLIKTNPRIHYLVVGLPTMQSELERLADQLQIRSHIHFFGRLSTQDLQAAYNACDIFVLTSRHSADGQFEGYGIVVIEAALCGRPSIVANNSGLSETVQDGITGLIVPEDDPVATASAIQFLLNFMGRCAEMGETARKWALAKQTWSIKMKEYDSLLRELLRYNE